jgi:predicted dehydrogenase
MSKPLRVAVIGAGWASEMHLQAYAASPDAELAAVCSRTRSRAEEVAGKFGVSNVYTSADELLQAEQLDVVSIATPPDSHLQYTEAAADRGCHVLCDKPVALDAHQAKQLLDAAVARKVHHATGFIWRRDPAILRLRSLVAEGSVGDVREIHCRCALGAPILPMTWMYDAAAGGGSLMQHGQHIIDRVRWIMGEEVTDVCGQLIYDVKQAVVGPQFHNVFDAFQWGAKRMAGGGEDLPSAEVTADTGYAFTATLANGVRAYFWEAMHSFGASPDQVEILGTRATLAWSANGGLALVRPRQPPEPIQLEATSAAGAGDLADATEAGHRYWRELVQAFLDDISGREHEPYPTLYDGWKVQQVVDAVRVSTGSRAWESIT